MNRFIPLFFSAAIFLHGEYELRYYEPKKPLQKQAQARSEPKSYLSDKRVVLQSVKGLVIAPEGERPADYVIRTARGVQIYRLMQDMTPKKRAALETELNRLVIGKTLTLEKMEEIKREISKFYQDNGHSLVIVNIPEQDVTDGVVLVTVLEARLGKVEIHGNKWFSNEWYLERVSLQEDEKIRTGEVDKDVAWINDSPWRRATVLYKPGSSYGTTDVELYVRDARPFKIFVGADNTGFKAIDYSRIFAGLNWGNLFNLDHNISYQYVASPDFKKFQAHMLEYTLPLPRKDDLDFVFGCSFIDLDHLSGGVPTSNNKGNDWQFSSQYGFFISPQGNLFQKAKAGFDWKRTNNQITDSVFNTISKSYVTILQLKGHYDLSYTLGEHLFEFSGDAYLQPWGFGNTMSKENYSDLRPGANVEYIYARVKGSYLWTEPKTKWGVSVKGRIQVASGTLLPLETLGLGGINSVRGYVERVADVDNGAILNLEVRTPSISLFKEKIEDGLSAIAFLDMGGGTLSSHLSSQPKGYFLAGIGPALRYNFSSYLYARFDLGIRLTGEPFASPTDDRVRYYFSVIGSY